MANLKDLRNRIGSVKSTQKITSAMKMVAAAKLRRAQEEAEAARPYAERMDRMLGGLAQSVGNLPGAPKLLTGTGRDDVHLLLVATADRGLCGNFNSSILRAARRKTLDLIESGKTVKIFCVGRKSSDFLRREFETLIVERVTGIDRPRLEYAAAGRIAAQVLEMSDAGEFDVCTVFYNRFKSALTQITTAQQLIPFPIPEEAETIEPGAEAVGAVYEYEPSESEILADLLPRNLGMQIFRALLENRASEHGSRMTAMDSATRNAGEMIDGLTLVYNRTRQAVITKELIEIVSGAEAL